MPSTASTTYADFVEGKLLTRVDTSTTTGVTFRIKDINGTTPTCPTAAFRLKVVQRTANNVKVEKWGVAAGTTQSGNTVTLGTLTRALPLNNGTDFTGSGTAQSFAAGADVFLSWDSHDAAQSAKLDIVNTMTGSGAIRSSSTTTAVVRHNSLTTAQRTAMTAANGDVVYDTDLSTFFQYKGGAWVEIGDTGTSAATTTTLGSAEKGTTADIRAETATGDGGGPIFIPADATAVLKDDRIVLKDATELTIATGAITVTQPYHTVDTESDAASDDLDTVTAAVGVGEVIILTPAHTDRTVVVKHNTGNIKLADSLDFSMDSTEKSITLLKQTSNWIELARGDANRTTVKTVYASAASSTAVGSSSTSVNVFDTHAYTIPANDLIAGVGYEFELSIAGVWVAGETDITLQLGSTVIAQCGMTPSATGDYHVKGFVMGTTTAGASAAVRGSVLMNQLTGASADYGTQNVATNGPLALQWGFKFFTSNASHSAIITMARITKFSTTAF